VDVEYALNGEAGLDRRLREPSGECGGEGADRADIEKADGGAVEIVAGAPDGEDFKQERAEPESDWEMYEERMDVEHGF